MSTLSIVLDGVPTFYAGQNVTGRVTVNGQPPDDSCELRLKFHGLGETRWTEQETHYDHTSKKNVTRSVQYCQTEDYILIKQPLWTNAQGIPLRKGQVFQFCVTIPPDVPPSFKGQYGWIKYTLGAKIKRPVLKFDKKETLNIAVVPLCSMAHLLNMMEPVMMKKEKELGMLFWKQGHIQTTVTIPKSVYITGETIPISGQIMNHSSVVIKNTKAELHQTVTYHCRGKTRVEKTVVAKCKQGEIQPGTIFIWTNVALVVPKNIPPSDFGPRCRLFSSEHRFEFRVNPAGMHFDVELNTPIKLGTVWGHPPPLAIPVPQMMFPTLPAHGAVAASAPPAPSAPGLYPELAFEAPPSYDEACGSAPPVEIGTEASPDDSIGKDFEKIKLG